MLKFLLLKGIITASSLLLIKFYPEDASLPLATAIVLVGAISTFRGIFELDILNTQNLSEFLFPMCLIALVGFFGFMFYLDNISSTLLAFANFALFSAIAIVSVFLRARGHIYVSGLLDFQTLLFFFMNLSGLVASKNGGGEHQIAEITGLLVVLGLLGIVVHTFRSDLELLQRYFSRLLFFLLTSAPVYAFILIIGQNEQIELADYYIVYRIGRIAEFVKQGALQFFSQQVATESDRNHFNKVRRISIIVSMIVLPAYLIALFMITKDSVTLALLASAPFFRETLASFTGPVGFLILKERFSGVWICAILTTIILGSAIIPMLSNEVALVLLAVFNLSLPFLNIFLLKNATR